MAELYESSGLLSLASLREDEKRRAHQQAEAARVRAEAEQRARLEAERESARIAEERRRAERAAFEARESARHAEQMRLEASQRTEADRAQGLLRTTEELKLSLGLEREARRNSELGLTAKVLRQRLLTSLAVALCVGTWLGASALYFGALRPAADRALMAAQQSLLSEQRARSEAEATNARSVRHNAELESRVSSLDQSLRDERARRTSSTEPQKVPQRPVIRQPLPTTSQQPCRDDGDPLNPCLKRSSNPR